MYLSQAAELPLSLHCRKRCVMASVLQHCTVTRGCRPQHTSCSKVLSQLQYTYHMCLQHKVYVHVTKTAADDASLQVFGCNIPGTKGRYMYGTGIISVIGTSFTFLTVTQTSIRNMMVSTPFC